MYSILPPLDVQNAIVKYLDNKNETIEKFILNKENFIKLLEEQKNRVVDDYMKGIYTENSFVDSTNKFIGKVPKNWSLKRLKYIAIVKGRIGFVDTLFKILLPKAKEQFPSVLQMFSTINLYLRKTLICHGRNITNHLR